MTQKPTSADRPALRAVIVTLDNHIAGAVNRAASNLRNELPGFELSVHAATDWAGNPASLERCKKDIAEGHIILANMLFIEEHIQAIMPALLARRESCDAMAGFMSAGEVIKLTRLGRFNMDGTQGGIVAMLKRLRGAKKHDSTAGAQQLAMLKRLPQILRFIPGTAQDVRAYFLTMQYWLAGSEDNIGNLMRFLVSRYAEGPRKILRSRIRADQPKAYPDYGVYHPRLPARIGEHAEKLPSPQGPQRGTVGIMLMRSYVLAGDTGHYDGVIEAFEQRGLKVIPAFATGLDSRPAIEKFFMKSGVAIVDAVVSLSGFSLVGGPAYNDAKAAETLLAKLDVPYIAAHPVEFQTMQQWGASDRGLLPVESTIMVAIPELEGSTGPAVFGGRSDGSNLPCTGCEKACVFPVTKTRDMHVCPERAEMLAARVAKLVSLRRSDRASRKLGLIIFNFPPNAGNTGTAAYLSVFESIHNTLVAMKSGGYEVDVPPTVEALRDAVIHGNAARYGAMANVAATITADDHVRRETYLAAIEKQWGPAPGKQQSDGSNIHVLGARFGNVFVGVQPAFGYEGDPMRLLFEKGFAPTHAFSAFYRWLREDFGANAVLHFGTHGALEFMPGKQADFQAFAGQTA